MPLGIRQLNNILHATLDVWEDKVFYNEREYPAGYFATSILNLSDDELIELVTLAGNIRDVPTRENVTALLTALRRYEPFSLQDIEMERKTVDMLFSDEFRDSNNTQYRDFYYRYLNSLTLIPIALSHFVTAVQYFTIRYLMRLNRRDETHFAVAAHDCFTGEEFKKTMVDLQGIELESFTKAPALRSSYVFARHPSREERMVFVQRVFFDSYMDFLVYDLFNGLHHGHAPACCRNCGRYFLTQNAHTPQYCDGVAPQNTNYSCREYGAMQHQKEENDDHPINTPFKTRTNTIRQHYRRGKIPQEIRDKSLEICREYRDAAFLDKKFAAEKYILLMEQEAVYDEARRRLGYGN